VDAISEGTLDKETCKVEGCGFQHATEMHDVAVSMDGMETTSGIEILEARGVSRNQYQELWREDCALQGQ